MDHFRNEGEPSHELEQINIDFWLKIGYGPLPKKIVESED